MGDLKVVASSDLHGFGNTVGAPVFYHWTPPNPLPHFLPWLAVLSLLMLKPNRTGRAWWIWVPLALVAVCQPVARPLFGSIPADVFDLLAHALTSLGFGVAAVWLLSPYLEHRLRFLAFLKVLAATGVTSVFCYVVRQDWAEPGMIFGFLVYVGVCVLVTIVALSLAALVCRRQYRPARLTLWTALFTLALWIVISLPIVVVATMANLGDTPWMEMLLVVAAFAALTFGMLLPFLLLTFSNLLFRERMIALLHLGAAPPPPVVELPPPVFSPAT